MFGDEHAAIETLSDPPAGPGDRPCPGASAIRSDIRQAIASGCDGAGPAFNTRGDRFEVTTATVGDVLDMLNGFRLYRIVEDRLDENGCFNICG
jgi:hypothetical protein